MNIFLRAQFRYLANNSIKRMGQSGIGVLCSIAVLAALLLPVRLFAGIGFSGANISPAVSSPQLVCSGGFGTIELLPGTSCTQPLDWTATYFIDSSADGGSTWFTPSGASTGFVSATVPLIYNTPILTATTCYSLTYRVRLIGITSSCLVGTTFTSPLAGIQVCPQPDPITGPSAVCAGETITLATTSTGGAWSTSSLPDATVTTSGVVTGITAGSVVTISYTLPGGCAATKDISVLAPPTAITGPSVVCVGTSAAYVLSGGAEVGTWSSSNLAAGTIDPSTGNFNGSGADTTTIKFTNVAGCSVSFVVSVNAFPGAIACNGPICYSDTLLLCSSPSGGVWTSDLPAIASVDAGTGRVTAIGTAGGTATITYDVSGCSVTTVVTVNPKPAAIVGASSVCIGSSTPLTSATPGGTWSSSDGFVAFVGTSGVVSGITAGSATITYMLSTGCFETKDITVDVAASSIGFSGGAPAVCVGRTMTLTATPAGGNWTSGLPTIATVDMSTGVVTGVAFGTATITYTLPTGCRSSRVVTVNPTPTPITGNLSICAAGDTSTLSSTPTGGAWTSSWGATATVGVSTGLVTSGAISGTVTMLYTLVGGCSVTTVFTVLPTPSTIGGPSTICVGEVSTLTNTVAGGTWVSSIPANASIVASTGDITGVAVGTSDITYTLPSGCATSSTVTVSPSPAPITGTLVMCVGQTVPLANATPGGTWTGSNSAIALVDTFSGDVTGVSPGSDIISYSLSSGCRSTAVVTINPLPGVIMGPLELCKDATGVLTSIPAGGTWSSSISPIASIGTSSGLVTAILPGSTVITVTSPDGCSRDTLLTVNPLPLPIDGTLRVCVGSTTALSNASAGGSGTWSSSNAGVAAINSFTGLVTGISAGTANITYTLPTGCVTSSVVTVDPLPALISGYARTCIGYCTPLGSATAGGTWSSSDPSIATISSTGNLCGVAPGTALISYTLPTGCARTKVAYIDAIPNPPTGVLNICVGSTTTLSHDTAGGTWTSSDTIVAKVFLGTGVVTSYNPGTANITYTLPSGCTSFATVTVSPIPPASTGTLYMCAGNTTTLSNLYPGGGWSSTNTSVATVGTGGVVTGVSAGTARISYTLASGCGVSSTVTVYPLPAIIGSVLVCRDASSTLTGSPAGGLWASSPTAIATVGSLSGVVTGQSTGTARITYTLATTCRSTAVVTVQPQPAIINGPSNVCVGSSITLTNFTPGGGTWASSNSSVATIDTAGLVTGVTAGVVTITFTATSTGCFITKSVTVNPLPAAISGPTEVCVGSTVTVTSASPGGTWTSSGTFASVASATGVVTGVSAGIEEITYTLPTGCLTTYLITVNPLPATITGTLAVCHGYTVSLSTASTGGTWSISPTTVATIDTDGLVTAVTPGTAVATYTLPTGCLTTAVVTVNPLPSPITGTLNICVNDTVTVYNSVPGGIWTSQNFRIAVIDDTLGLLASVSAGTVAITYTLPTGCYTTAIMTINPIPPPITGTFVLCEGSFTTLTDTTTGGSWSSSAPSIATIGSASGLVTAISPGTTIITYRLPSSCPRTAIFTVNPNPASITGVTSICKGDTTYLSSATAGGTWSSSNPSVAFIFMPTGQLIGLNTGTATITYMMPTGCFALTTVVINPIPLASAITGSRVVCVGDMSTLVSPAPFGGGTWATADPTIATIGLTSGTFTGVSPGTTTIRYTLPTGCDTFVVVTVNPLPSAITGVADVCVGNTTLLSNATPGGTWISGNTAVATISSGGLVTGVTDGTATITYQLSATGCRVTRVVTVHPLPAVIVGSDHMCEGSTIVLSDSDPGGAWSSGNPAVATVTAISAGFDSASVSGLTAGNVYITYTLPTGCFRTHMIVVHPLPAPIAGTDTVCEGSTVVLTSLPAFPTTSAGSWTSGDTSIATIDTTTGVLTGVHAGVVTITFTNDYGCTVFYPITVYPLPTPIFGIDNVCETFTITAFDTTGGGVWSISDTSVATITSTDDTSAVITGVGAGIVTLTYTLPTGCFVARELTVHPLPDISVTVPTIICKYSSTTLTASGADTAGTYTWSPSIGLSATVGPVVVANPTITTTYVVTGTTRYGCPDTAHVTVLVDSLLNDISITGQDSICKGDCTVLVANGREGTFFSWKPATSLSCTICDTVTACPLNTITYNALAIDSLGCRDSLFYTVTVMPLPVMKVLPNPAIVCNGSTTQLTVTDSFATSSYVTRFAWFPNAFISCDTCPNPIISNTANLVYRVTGITPFGCHDSLRVPVTVLDSAFNSINKDTVICTGESVQLNAVSFNPDGARSDFYWFDPTSGDINNQYIANPIVKPVVTTTYTVAITPNVCWPDTLYTTVVVAPYPDITLDPTVKTVAPGSRVTLTATINNEMIVKSYAWSPPATLSCDTCFETVAMPLGTTRYTFTVTSIYGCTDSGTVTINTQCENTQVFKPNVFTPNGDGMNDRFFVQGTGIRNVSKFLIYNRWGELVYERYNFPANDAAYGWDGQYKGIVLPPSVFVYIIEAECELGEVFQYTGDISIVR